MVRAEAMRLGFTHQTLTWHGEKPAAGLQAAARDARYALLAAAIRAEHETGGPLRVLLTAHHADDQAETLLMRLARGSGVSGLSAMRTRSSFRGLTVVRPLLGVPKARLIATLEACGSRWFEDPSNVSDDFERVRIRSALAHLLPLGFDAGRLALSAQRLARADEALERQADALAHAASLDRHGGAYASVVLSRFQDAPAEVRIRVLGRMLAENGGIAPLARLSQVEDLDGHIAVRSGEGRATLGGCTLHWGRDMLNVFREAGRDPLPEVTLQPGGDAIWDNRFRVFVLREAGPPDATVTIKAVGMAGYATLRRGLNIAPPALAGATLPAFFQEDRLIAVPYFGGASTALKEQLYTLPSSLDPAGCRAEPISH